MNRSGTVGGWIPLGYLVRAASSVGKAACRGSGGAPANLAEMRPSWWAAAGIPSLRRRVCLPAPGRGGNVAGLQPGTAHIRLLSSMEGGRMGSSQRGKKGRAAKAGSVRPRDLLRQLKDLAHQSVAAETRQRRLQAIETIAVRIIDRFEFKDLSQVCVCVLPFSPSHPAFLSEMSVHKKKRSGPPSFPALYFHSLPSLPPISYLPALSPFSLPLSKPPPFRPPSSPSPASPQPFSDDIRIASKQMFSRGNACPLPPGLQLVWENGGTAW